MIANVSFINHQQIIIHRESSKKNLYFTLTAFNYKYSRDSPIIPLHSGAKMWRIPHDIKDYITVTLLAALLYLLSHNLLSTTPAASPSSSPLSSSSTSSSSSSSSSLTSSIPQSLVENTKMVYPAVRIPATTKHTASVIFLHGLGDSGRGWTFLAETVRRQNKLSHVKFIFPNAPEQPVSMNYGMTMPSWYDIQSLGNVEALQDREGVLKSVERLKSILAEEMDAGIPSDRIVIGGFSQGCAVSYATSVTIPQKLAGVVALSGYLPIESTLKQKMTDANKDTPVLACHGTADNVVKFMNGDKSYKYLRNELGRTDVRWNQYEGMVHTASPEEVEDVVKFLEEVIPE